ncbi:TonB-dependent receptor [Sphingomonas flavescens]|uniref:TonB-dependent receptor n=1 Tax=Sphingomonas flavescens TaxID=3132797 RepID=UPI0028056480|nr:TonB-dependent receptor [Sphingomonas limnosediminicola]
MKLPIGLLTTAAVFVPATAIAQQASAPATAAIVDHGDHGGAGAADEAPPTPGTAAGAHEDEDQAIVITGTKRRAGDVLGNVSVLDAEELAHDLKPSIGDTLADLPGVSASSFGPSSSRPILRGEQGERAPILVDGIGSLDLSASDPDHAVTINPLTAERIEVLHGPGALLYAPSAVAGVVNVIDGRIPRRHPDEVDGDVLLNYGSAANERSANAGIDAPLGKKFVAHVDGAYSKYDDLHVGGYLLSEPLRKQALASTDPDIRALADLKGKLPNTSGRTDDAAAGVAYVDGDWNVGLSVSHHDSKYGVPIRFSLDPAVEAEAPTIDAHQNRLDARVNAPIGGFFKLFEFRGGLSKYHHAELDPSGAVGTRFYSNGGEMRADLVQTERGGWGGTTGVQYLSQDARIRGDEKYLPDSRKKNVGLFTVQSIEAGKVRLEAAGRVDFADLTAKSDPLIAGLVADAGSNSLVGTVPFSRKFTAVSGSVGANYEFLPGWRAGLSISHSERAPSIGELYAFGPHGGSEQFIIGDPNLKLERSNGAELSLHRTVGPVHIQGSVYYSRFSNFIFQAPTGAIEDGLPVYDHLQGKAKYYGFELESDVKFGKALGIDWGGEITTDAVRAKIKGFGNAPEIPPFRVLAGLTGTRGQVDGRIEVERTSSQNKAAPNETTTPGYTLVNASFDWHPYAANPELTLSLTANNIFDVEARRHASDLKDYAPLAGRDIRLTARLGF